MTETPVTPPLSAADRIRARLKGDNNAVVIPKDPRPAWLKLIEQFEDIGPDSTESRTHEFAEQLADLAEHGEPVPGELLIMAVAYLRPRYRADRDRSRTHDPATSAAAEPKPRGAGCQAHRVLEAFAAVNPTLTAPYYGGLTAPEAALMIGKPGAYRRTPELHHDGLVEELPWSEYAGPKPVDGSAGLFPEMPATRLTIHGQQARVFRITELGRDELRRLAAAERAKKRARGNGA